MGDIVIWIGDTNLFGDMEVRLYVRLVVPGGNAAKRIPPGAALAEEGFELGVYRGTLLIRKRQPPKDPPRTLGIGLR